MFDKIIPMRKMHKTCFLLLIGPFLDLILLSGSSLALLEVWTKLRDMSLHGRQCGQEKQYKIVFWNHEDQIGQYSVLHVSFFFLSSAIKYLETPIELVPNIATGVIIVKMISSFGHWSKELQDLNEKTSKMVGSLFVFLDTFIQTLLYSPQIQGLFLETVLRGDPLHLTVGRQGSSDVGEGVRPLVGFRRATLV